MSASLHLYSAVRVPSTPKKFSRSLFPLEEKEAGSDRRKLSLAYLSTLSADCRPLDAPLQKGNDVKYSKPANPSSPWVKWEMNTNSSCTVSIPMYGLSAEVSLDEDGDLDLDASAEAINGMAREMARLRSVAPETKQSIASRKETITSGPGTLVPNPSSPSPRCVTGEIEQNTMTIGIPTLGLTAEAPLNEKGFLDLDAAEDLLSGLLRDAAKLRSIQGQDCNNVTAKGLAVALSNNEGVNTANQGMDLRGLHQGINNLSRGLQAVNDRLDILRTANNTKQAKALELQMRKTKAAEAKLKERDAQLAAKEKELQMKALQIKDLQNALGIRGRASSSHSGNVAVKGNGNEKAATGRHIWRQTK